MWSGSGGRGGGFSGQGAGDGAMGNEWWEGWAGCVFFLGGHVFFRFYLVVFFLCTGDMWSWMRCCVRSPGVYLARLLGSAA